MFMPQSGRLTYDLDYPINLLFFNANEQSRIAAA
jgi:hypothetical protein